MTATRQRRRPGAGPVLVGLLLAACSACTAGDAAPPVAAPSPAVDLTPPTEAGSVATDPPRPQGAEVVLTRAGWDEGTGAVQAAGYVSPVVEDGGTCTLELSRGGSTRTAEAAAEPDATTTICAGLTVPGGQLSAGEWTAVLRYRSPGVEASSEPLVVEVPR